MTYPTQQASGLLTNWQGKFVCTLKRKKKIIKLGVSENTLNQFQANAMLCALTGSLLLGQFVDSGFYVRNSNPQYYIKTIGTTYIGNIPPVVGQWYIGLINTPVVATFNGLVLPSDIGPGSSLTLFPEETNYVDINNHSQRVLWEPDEPENGICTNNSALAEFHFTKNTLVYALFLASNPIFYSGVTLYSPMSGTPTGETPARLLSWAPFPATTGLGTTVSVLAGDVLGVQYRVSF